MPAQLFMLNGVPDDEADEVRALLSAHGIDYYETKGGRWGISVAAIWLRDEAQMEAARGLLNEYQTERSARLRGEYEQRKREGRAETMLDRIRREPLLFMVYLGVVLVILYLSIKPFIDFGR